MNGGSSQFGTCYCSVDKKDLKYLRVYHSAQVGASSNFVSLVFDTRWKFLSITETSFEYMARFHVVHGRTLRSF